MNHILVRHEQGAAHAADGYARATGKTGVCFATSGPGATNLVTGIATAYMDSVPIVAITCNVTVPLLGKDSFQEIDITGVTLPITKHNFIVKDIKELANVIRKAFKIARSGRPGPVSIDIAKESERAIVDIETLKKTNKDLIDTIEELKKIHDEGRAKRQEAEVELQNIEKELGIATCPMNWPIGSGKDFKGIYDRKTKNIITYIAKKEPFSRVILNMSKISMKIFLICFFIGSSKI